MSSTSPATTGLANVQRVMIVNGNAEMLRSLEPALEQGHCDIVVVESIEYAYSHIRREQPSLVILCVRLDRAPEFQLLSMLKLDRATRAIPVLDLCRRLRQGTGGRRCTRHLGRRDLRAGSGAPNELTVV